MGGEDGAEGGVAGFCLHDGMRVPVVFLESFAVSDATTVTYSS